MEKHEKIPQETLPVGFVKRLVLAAVEAVPTVLPEKVTRWWPKKGGPAVLAKAIRDVMYNPPTLRNRMTSWRRFYATMFGCELPSMNGWGFDSLADDLADGYVLVNKSVVTAEAIIQMPKKFPEIFHEAWLITDSRFMSRTIGKFRDFPSWYLIGIAPQERGSHFERGNDEGGVSFEELFVQQLFAYWSGDTLSRDWLYANGSRTSGERVPGIQWIDRKMITSGFDRDGFCFNLKITRCLELQ